MRVVILEYSFPLQQCLSPWRVGTHTCWLVYGCPGQLGLAWAYPQILLRAQNLRLVTRRHGTAPGRRVLLNHQGGDRTPNSDACPWMGSCTKREDRPLGQRHSPHHKRIDDVYAERRVDPRVSGKWNWIHWIQLALKITPLDFWECDLVNVLNV